MEEVGRYRERADGKDAGNGYLGVGAEAARRGPEAEDVLTQNEQGTLVWSGAGCWAGGIGG